MKISKKSKLYKFYERLSNSFLFDDAFEYDNGNLTAFNDVCTFTRTTLKVLLQLALYVFVIAFLLVGAIIVAVLLFFGFDSDGFSMQSVLVGLGLVLFSYLYAYISTKATSGEIKTDKTIISEIYQVVSKRSDKLCIKIDLED